MDIPRIIGTLADDEIARMGRLRGQLSAGYVLAYCEGIETVRKWLADLTEQEALSFPDPPERFTFEVTGYGDTADEVEASCFARAAHLTGVPRPALSVTGPYRLGAVPPQGDDSYIKRIRDEAAGRSLYAEVHVAARRAD